MFVLVSDILLILRTNHYVKKLIYELNTDITHRFNNINLSSTFFGKSARTTNNTPEKQNLDGRRSNISGKIDDFLLKLGSGFSVVV